MKNTNLSISINFIILGIILNVCFLFINFVFYIRNTGFSLVNHDNTLIVRHVDKSIDPPQIPEIDKSNSRALADYWKSQSEKYDKQLASMLNIMGSLNNLAGQSQAYIDMHNYFLSVYKITRSYRSICDQQAAMYDALSVEEEENCKSKNQFRK